MAKAVDPQGCPAPGRRAGTGRGEVQIATPAQYRDAVAEVQRLQAAREGSPDLARRQALRAAMHEFERRHMVAECTQSRPR
ncbi:MAG TPA: hypothetical protein VME41_11100 [Stellaceae bacterium]|nr:hypothetical protein [Stellaceae bacterium]